eukprot:2780150-Prymnesium_polylepis.1
MRHFCVIQFRPDRSIKYRPCDNAAESGHNVTRSRNSLGTPLLPVYFVKRPADFGSRLRANENDSDK